MEDTNNYSSDAPIMDLSEDKFNRYPFAKRIAEVISGRTDPSSIVIGINGAWGEGKTSVFNFIENELKPYTEIVCLKFNPWRFGTEETMLINFFNYLADAIDSSLETKTDKISNLINTYGIPIAKATGFNTIAEGVSPFLANGVNLDKLKTRLEEKLNKEQIRVVVLVDNIDRLDKNEIHSLFRLIKLTADFKYTAYVLAFDKEVVTSALQDKYSYSSSFTGASFLEKIIQVPLQLPAADLENLRDYCLNELKHILEKNKIDLSYSEKEEFYHYFTTSLELFLRTPRQAKLYGNILTFSLPLLKGEVNVVDLMLIEGIRVFTPIIYTFIRDNRDLFLSENTSSETDKEEKVQRIKEALKGLDNEEFEGMLNLLKYLFPQLNSIYTIFSIGEEEDQLSLKQRISAKDYFQRYFSYSVNNKDISDMVLDDLLKIADSLNEIKVKEKFNKIITEQNRESIMTKLRRKTRWFTINQAKHIALALANISNDLPIIDGFMRNTKFGNAAYVIVGCISSVKDSELRLSICRNILKSIDNLDFSIETFILLNPEKENNKNFTHENLLSENDYKELARYLTEIIASRLYGGKTKGASEYLAYMFAIWNDYGLDNEATDYLIEKLQQDEFFVFEFLERYTPVSYSGRNRGDFEIDNYKAVCRLIDPQIIIDHLLDKYPLLPNDEEYPSSFDIERNELLARQFIWLNNNPQ